MLRGRWGNTCLDQALPSGTILQSSILIVDAEADTAYQIFHVYWQCDTDGRTFANSRRGLFESSAAANCYVTAISEKARGLPMRLKNEVSVPFSVTKTQFSDTHQTRASLEHLPPPRYRPRWNPYTNARTQFSDQAPAVFHSPLVAFVCVNVSRSCCKSSQSHTLKTSLCGKGEPLSCSLLWSSA